MKLLSLSFALCAALLLGINAFAEDAKKDASPELAKAAAPVAPAASEYKGIDNPGACIARGIANLTTGWLEIPRCAIYDNSYVPFFGIIVGIPEGAFFTLGRTLTGTLDIISFGFTRDGMHGKGFPDFVWQAKWLPDSSK